MSKKHIMKAEDILTKPTREADHSQWVEESGLVAQKAREMGGLSTALQRMGSGREG